MVINTPCSLVVKPLGSARSVRCRQVVPGSIPGRGILRTQSHPQTNMVHLSVRQVYQQKNLVHLSVRRVYRQKRAVHLSDRRVCRFFVLVVVLYLRGKKRSTM